ncbi:hypothetical protein V495_00764 [Pseudogymnoascus sp. VKM F-4514 (FW-929)]|nr:hypothetical protein V495_00764 [Pseudogymnoascus sp. VKM F-4514 (FW-929)]KFY51736.1 hypothetical protein V497_08883 [Pseudogymnoascus sp. VKM F-4516 (FW-969)]
MADAGMDGEFGQALRLRVVDQEAEITRLRTQNRRKEQLLERQQQQLAKQQQQLDVCHQRYGDNCHLPWTKDDSWLKQWREHDFTRDPGFLACIIKVACRQCNMSSCCRKHGRYWVPEGHIELEIEPRVANPEAGFQPGKFFDIVRLMNEFPEIFLKIAAYTMVRHTAISAVARIDPYAPYPPLEGSLDPKTGLPYRLHSGGRAIAINSAPRTKDELAPMLVCRDWHEIFGTAFYFLNSFCVDSLGEFEIFERMTPDRALKRIRAMFITWLGSRMETSNPNRKGPRYDKSRHCMHKLKKLVNLQLLEINIDESSRLRRRRIHEPKSKKRPLLKSTKSHENFTGNRSLRTLRGLDSITQLRGVKCLKIFDYNQPSPRTTIRDRTFLEDTRRQVYSPKSRAAKAKANLKNLKPLLKSKGPGKWVMSEQVRKIVHGIFDMFPDEVVDVAEDDVEDEWAINADDSDDSDDDDDQNSNQNLDDRDDTNQNQHHDSDSDESGDDDDAPDQGANASRAAFRARNIAHGSGEHGSDEDEDVEMGGLEQENEGFGSIRSASVRARKSEEDADFEVVESRKTPDIQFIRCVKRPAQMIDLTGLPDLEGPETVFPSIEEDGVKQEVKTEDEDSVGGSMENIPAFQDRPRASSPFGNLSMKRAQTGQSSLFVRQTASSRRSLSSRDFGHQGRQSSERNQTIKDESEEEGEGEDISARLSVRRRLSYMAIDEEDMEE